MSVSQLVEPSVFDTAGAARFLGVSVELLEKWRSVSPDAGPAFIRVTPRCIRYRRSDLLDFMAARVVGGVR